MSLIQGTDWLSLDEPCFGLSEVNLPSPVAGQGLRRYEVAYVVRGDALAEHRRDLGPAHGFTAQQFRIPGGVLSESNGHRRYEIVETVGRLRDVADHLRDGRIPEPEMKPTDLLGQWADQLEQRQRAARGRGLSIVTAS